MQDFLFLCWNFDFLLCSGIVASCEGGRCKKYRRAVQWSASLNCSLSQNCHKTFAFSPLIPKQMIADPQTWEEQLVQITSSEWKFSVYIFRPGKQTLQNSYFRKKPYDVVDYQKNVKSKTKIKLIWECQAEGWAAEDAVPLQRPHWGPEALLHQSDDRRHHHHHRRRHNHKLIIIIIIIIITIIKYNHHHYPKHYH